MKARMKTGLAALAFLVASGGAAALAHPRPGHRPGGPAALGRLAQRLDLSAAQRAKLEEIEDRRVRDAIQAKGRIELARHELRRLAEGEDPDRAKVFAKIDELARLHAERRKIQIAARLDERSVLVPEQREKLRELLRERRARRSRERAPERHGGGATDTPPEVPQEP